MKKYIHLLPLVFFLTGAAYSQHLCKGVLIDQSTLLPVEFANVGVVGKGAGTVSNEKGEYSFTIPDSLLNEQVKVSIIGYKARVFTVSDFQKQTQIPLVQDVTTLNEVAVTAKKTKTKVVGNNTLSKFISAGFIDNSLGAEIGVRLSIKNPQTQIKRVMINITRNSLDTLPVFRLNIYRTGDKGMPGENILTKNIILSPKEKTGLLEFDLVPYQILVDDDIFVTIEWIKDLGDLKGLYFSSRMGGNATYYRQTSQGKWTKMSSVGIGLHAEIAY